MKSTPNSQWPFWVQLYLNGHITTTLHHWNSPQIQQVWLITERIRGPNQERPLLSQGFSHSPILRSTGEYETGRPCGRRGRWRDGTILHRVPGVVVDSSMITVRRTWKVGDLNTGFIWVYIYYIIYILDRVHKKILLCSIWFSCKLLNQFYLTKELFLFDSVEWVTI